MQKSSSRDLQRQGILNFQLASPAELPGEAFIVQFLIVVVMYNKECIYSDDVGGERSLAMNDLKTVLAFGKAPPFEDLPVFLQSKVVVVEFYGANCGPCKKASGPFAALAEKWGRVNFRFVSVEVYEAFEHDPEFASHVDCTPTFSVYVDGIRKVGDPTWVCKGASSDTLKKLVESARHFVVSSE